MPKPLRHVPVLLQPVIDCLRPRPGMTLVDCTLGSGGHSLELLPRLSPGGTLVGLDFDQAHVDKSAILLRNLAEANVTLHLRQSNFAALPTILAEVGIQRVSAILADVGVASPQIDNPARGFSYRRPGPLDMRMDATRGQPASALVNRLSERELSEAFLELGDETDAPQIAKLIVQRRQRSPIETTEQLTAIICEARDFTLERAAGAKLHPAARTFQALRMLVNRELPNLQRLLDVAPSLLNPGGRIAVISFHSGEDRLVKHAFREGHRSGVYSAVTDEPITASEREISQNPRSRSAKLRWAEK